METQVLMIFNINENKLESLVPEGTNRETIAEALRSNIQNVVVNHLANDDAVDLIIAVNDPDPRIKGAKKCIVQLVPDGTYIVRGDDDLCVEVREKLNAPF